MKTLKELAQTHGSNKDNLHYFFGYKEAIQGILKDIENAEVISVASIEKYLNKLLDN